MTRALSPGGVHEPRSRGLNITCLDAWHARTALKVQINKTDLHSLWRSGEPFRWSEQPAGT